MRDQGASQVSGSIAKYCDTQVFVMCASRGVAAYVAARGALESREYSLCAVWAVARQSGCETRYAVKIWRRDLQIEELSTC